MQDGGLQQLSDWASVLVKTGPSTGHGTEWHWKIYYRDIRNMLASEMVCGKGTILWAQEIRMLWLIYPLSCLTRSQLLIEGNALTLIKKTKKLYFERAKRKRNSVNKGVDFIILISCDGADIESALIRLGCIFRSSLIFERIRNKDGELTRFPVSYTHLTLPTTAEV